MAEIDKVAFDQEELYDLLDENVRTIYLCGEKFIIPLSKPDMTYIGVNSPVAVINSKTSVDWQKKSIILKDVIFDSKYQAVLDSENRTQGNCNQSNIDGSNAFFTMGAYSDRSFLNFMLSSSQKKSSEKRYHLARDLVETVSYDADSNIKIKKELVERNQLVGMGTEFLDRL